MNTRMCAWSLVLLPFASIAPVHAAGPELSTVNRTQSAENYGKLPLSFEANQGQADGEAKFLSRGSGYGFYLTARGAILVLQSRKSQRGKQVDTAVLRMGLVGANASAGISGIDRLPGTSNYFIGKNPERWHTNVPTYAAVKYAGVYQGVDLVYHGKQQQLEYDFVLAAGAKVKCIQLSFDGAKTISIDRSGDLRIIATGDRAVVMHAPVAYQESDGSRRLVAARYVLDSRTRVGFRLGTYDRSRPLVIDPKLVYSTYLGGSGGDAGPGGGNIAVDASGNAYVTGGTASFDFPVTPGAFQTAFRGSGCGAGCSENAFVSKLNADGSALVYSTYLGGSVFTNGFSIAIDASGSAYVTGATDDSDFPTTAGAVQTVYSGGSDAFVSKLNAAGSALVYSTYLGGSGGDDAGDRIALDAWDNAYVTGYTASFDFPTTPGAFQTTYAGRGDAFISKLNAAGSALVYSTFLGGNDDESVSGIAVDTSGNAYVTGNTASFDFPTTPGAVQTIYPAGLFGDAFVSKLNAAGSALVYSTYLGGSGSTWGSGIVVDTSGEAYVTGATDSSDFPTTAGALQTTYAGDRDAFVSKLNAAGSALVYSSYLGGSAEDWGTGIAVDSSGNAYVTGFTDSSNFPITSGAFQPACGGGSGFPAPCRDAFLSRLGAAGSTLVYSTYLGGNNDDEGLGIAMGASGNAYVTGWTASSNFPVTPYAFQRAFGGATDAFITKFRFGIPFATFKPRLRLDVDKGAFDLTARFALGERGSINPVTEPVTLGIGPYSVTIPAGSFKRHGEDYRFKGVIAGVHLEVSIHRRCRPRGDDRDLDQPEDPNCPACEGNEAPYELTADGKGANLGGITNPVAVSLSIGNNTGSTEVTADFE